MSIVASLAIALSLFTGAPAISAPADVNLTYDSPVVTTVAADEPQEDEPGWDCHIHGNKVCSGTELFTPEDEGEAIDPAELAALNAPAVRPHYQEDDPQWDCYVDGNRVCGPLKEHMEHEAWDRFTPDVLPPVLRNLGFKATYMGTMMAGAPMLEDSWHTYHPSSKLGYNHVFSIQFDK